MGARGRVPREQGGSKAHRGREGETGTEMKAYANGIEEWTDTCRKQIA